MGVLLLEMIVGAGLGLVACWVWRSVTGSDYALAAVLGAILLPFGASIYIWFVRSGRSLRVESFKIKLPVVGETTVVVSEEHRIAGWKIFVEAATRIATRTLAPGDGLLREALTSLKALFDATRAELKAVRPSMPLNVQEGEYTIVLYEVRMLNDALRPFLARWHPRLSHWEKRGQPETTWPLADACRGDLEVTRKRMYAFTRGLGDLLRLPQLDGLLPKEAIVDPPPALMSATDLAKLEASLPPLAEPQGRLAWRFLVELSVRLPAEAAAAEVGDLHAAVKSLQELSQQIRTELRDLSPSPSGGGKIEALALEVVGKVRDFVTKWLPMLEAHAKSGAALAQADLCRQELGELRISLTKAMTDLEGHMAAATLAS